MCQGTSFNSNEGFCCHKSQKTLQYLMFSGFQQSKCLDYADFANINCGVSLMVRRLFEKKKKKKKENQSSQEHK